MPLTIETEEAEVLARELASVTHESLTEAVTIAIRERLERVRRSERAGILSRLDRLSAEYTALPVEDARSVEEIIGYDRHGLPA